MGVMDRYNEKKKKNEEGSKSKTTSGGVAERYERYQYYQTLDVDSVDENYINTFLSDTNSFFSSVNDKSISYGAGKSILGNLRTRYDTIQGWLHKNKSKFNVEAYKSLSSTFDGLQSSFDGLNDYYSKWETEDDYNEAVEQAESDAKRWNELTGGYDPSKNQAEGKAGWDDYIATQESIAKNQEQAAAEMPWWEKMVGYLGNTPQAPIPYEEAKEGYRNWEKSMKKPNDRWTDEQRETFGYLWNEDRQQSWQYAYAVNNMLNTQLESEQIQNMQKWATDNFGAGAVHTVGAILAAPLGLADWLNDMAAEGALGYIPESDGIITPFEYSQAVTSGVSQHFNETGGTLNENIPIIGGKGWGDVYGLGVSIAQSALSAYTGGSGQALISFFGSASAAGVDDAVRRGVNGRDALLYGTSVGAAEALSEMIGVDNLLKIGSSTGKKLFVNLIKQGGAEGLEEGFSSFFSNVADNIFSGDNSRFNILVANYIDKGMNEETAKKKAWSQSVQDIVFDMLGGFASGGVHAGPQIAWQNHLQNQNAKDTYGSSQRALVGESLAINPNNAYAQKMQGRLDAGNNLSGGQLNRLVQQNEAAMTAQDMSNIQRAAESRLTELGETGDVSAIAAALTKQAAGEKLSMAEKKLISNSKYGQRVANELNTKNIQSGNYSSEWAQKLDTNRINVDEYSRLVEAAQLPQETAEVTGGQVATEVPKAEQVAQPEPETVQTAQEIATPVSAPARNDSVNVATGKESLQVAEEAPATEEPKAKAVTLEDVSKKYGAQAQAMIHTYTDGQDVAKYDAAYQVAYDMGKSGVSLSYVKNNQSASYLTDTQKELAYEAGKAASDTAAKELDAKNKAAANGKTGRKKGVVRGEGVTIADLKHTFNDTQGKAYKYLTSVAEATGIDIVLYRSEANADGEYVEAQGRYDRNEPGTLYIDLNAGLRNVNDVNKLHRYFMLRTFAHEFTHFIEKWNPIQYNEFRKVILDTLTQRGENVHDLIEDMQAHNPGMSYDEASREVVAEAMTDILPDANFAQELAQKHRNILQWLIDKLKEFVENLKTYYKTIGGSYYQGAIALKEQVGDTIKYLDSVVDMFDRVAVEAVENYQQTVATEEVAVAKTENTTTVSETESVAATEEVSPVVETDAYGFTISDNVEHGSLEITFDSKPSDAVRDVLKENKFRWHKAKKVWYGYGNRADITNALHAAYEADAAADTETVTEPTQTETKAPDTVTETPESVSKQAELDQKRARYNEVMEILNPKEEQALDSVAEDDVQYQGRDYLSEGENYDNRGIQTSSDRASGQHQSSQGRDWETTVDGRRDREDDRRSRKVKAWGDISAKKRLEIVKAVKSHIYNSANYDEIRLYLAAIIGKPVTKMNLQDHETAIEMLAQSLYASITDLNNSRPFVEQRWSFLGNVRPIIEAIYGENVQFQQRTNTLTDREVLALAASQVKVSDMTAAEKDALDIFQQRLSKLEALQEERAEQGRMYKEQQFGAKVDRAAAAETLNRMQVLDSQIQKASAEVLSVEEKTVLKRVLQKARTVVEQQERQHGQEILKRWRDRRNNADAIKKYRDRLRGDVDELTNWVLHPDNKNVVKHIPDALKNTVIPFLSSINFESKRSLAGGNPTQADKALMEQTRRLAKVMENTVDIYDMYSNYTDLPPDFMKNLRNFIDTAQGIVDNNSGDFIINQMTAEELKTLSKVVRTLKEYIMKMNRFHVNSMFKHVYDAGENSIDFMAQLKPAENTGAVSQFLLWQQMRPAYAFERFGDGGQAVYDGLRRGQATLAFNTKKITEFSKKAYTAAEVKAWENEVKTIRIGPGKTVTMPVSYIMGLYELNKREQAQGHIFGEGIRVATFKNGKKKISDVGQTLTPGELNMILRELTPRQKEVADNLQQFMEKQGGEWGNYVTVARFGEKQFGEPNYYPINSDGRHLSVEADEKPSAASLYALLNMGFTKQTQEKAKNRLIVYSIFDVFSNHMASMAQYNAFALPVVDALKWFNYQRVAIDEDGSKTILGSVREQMDRAFGVPEENRPGSGRRGYAQNFVINIIKALNGTEAQGTTYDSLGLQTLHRYNRAQVAYNFRVVVQQPLAITRAAQLLDYGSIIKGMKLQPAAIRKNIQEMQQYSGIAAWKSLGFYDVNISRGLTSIIKHNDTVLDKITDVGMWGAEKADTMTWAAIWSASKEEVIRKQKLTPKSEGFYEAVTKLFEEVIYKTQVVDSVLTKNEFMRDKGFLARAVGSFMSEPTTTASMLIDAYDKYHMDMQRGMNRQQAWKKNSKMIVRTAYVYGIGALILAAVQASADAFRDDDDYEEWYEKWLEAFGGNLVDELVPFNKLPILSDFYDLAKELLSILGVDTYGNPPQSVFMQWYDSLVKGTEIIYDKISGEDTNYTWYGGAYKLLQAAAGMTGLPMAGATREVVTAWNNIVGAMAPSLKVKTYDSGEKNEIKYAYQDGYLTAEEAIEQLLQQGVVDTESEAYFLVQGWEAGDGYSRYDAIFDAVRNGGDFNAAMGELTSHGYTEKDILSRVKSEIGKWYKGGEITKQQATNMLTKYIALDSEDAQNTVGEWAFGIEHPELEGRITYTQYKRWETSGKPSGVSLDLFASVADFRNDGTSDGVKSQDEVAAYIDSLNISDYQKDALWCCFWKESTLKNAPWH